MSEDSNNSVNLTKNQFEAILLKYNIELIQKKSNKEIYFTLTENDQLPLLKDGDKLVQFGNFHPHFNSTNRFKERLKMQSLRKELRMKKANNGIKEGNYYKN